MTTFLKIAVVVIGVGMSAWLGVVAHDLGNGFRRFDKLAGSTERRTRTAPAKHTATDRATGVV